MRKLAVIIVVVFHAIIVFAQAPQGFNYQGVARDNNGNILKSQTLGFRVSILADSTNGTVVYSESHTIVSNTNGVFELVVGQGTVVSGNFSAIDWGSASHFLKTEMDAAGGTNYVFYGTTQLMSVPYAMFAKNAGNVSYSDTSTTNELQILSLTNDTLYLSNGGFVVLPFNYNDTSATNELQIISISNDTLYLTNGGYVVLPGLIFKDTDFEIINETAFADAPATACTAVLAGSGAGNVDNGTHDYKITYITVSGETEPGPVSNSVTVTINATDGKILLTNIPISSDSGVVARKIYRRLYAAGTDYFLLDTIQDNTTTIYIDSIGFVSLGDTVPDSNTTEVKFKFDASQLTETRTYTMPDTNGEIALKETLIKEIMKSLGSIYSDVAQTLFNANYLGFGSQLFNGSPALHNVYYSILETDVAVSFTDFNHNTVDYRYDIDTSATTPIIILGTTSDIGENVTNVIPIVNQEIREYSDDTSIVANQSFETSSDWTWHNHGENNNFNGYIADAFVGVQCYRMGTTTDGFTNNHQEIHQTVDLTGVAKVTARIKRAISNGDNGNYSACLIAGGASDCRTLSTLSGGWDLFEVIVPIANRTPGQEIILRHIMSNPTASGSEVRYDDIRTIANETIISSVLTFSNDNSTFELCTNSQIHTPSTIGKKLLLKLTYTLSGNQDYVEGYVSEFAIKYNL